MTTVKIWWQQRIFSIETIWVRFVLCEMLRLFIFGPECNTLITHNDDITSSKCFWKTKEFIPILVKWRFV